MPLSIVRNDITKMDTDAIVNAANCELLAGGGVCGAIFSAAGYDVLEEACSKIGFCPTGEAVITPGFNLKAKYIIHTAGPVYSADNPVQEKQLYGCYYNSLTLAKKHGIESIAFPLISSGIYGYPRDEALSVARNAISDFLSEHEMQVYLVVYDRASFEVSKKLFDEVRSYIAEHLICTDRRYSAAYPEYNSYAPKAGLYEFDNIEELLKNKSETFSQMLLRLIDERNLKDSEVYKRANIDRKLFSKIRNDIDYHPKKSTALSFAIALELSLDKTEDLLNKAGYTLSHSSESDLVIEYFIKHRCYDILKINEVLFKFDLPLLSA